MDGLLIDSERFMWSPSMSAACEKQGFKLTDEFHNTYRGKSLRLAKNILIDHFGPKFDYDMFIKDTFEYNDICIEKGIPLMPGALELLRYLKDHDILTCIGTSTYRKETNRILEVDGIKDMFDEIVCGDEIKVGKPDPEAYLACLAKFKNIDKSEVLVFEDALAGGQSAISAGIRLVLVPDLAFLNDDIKNKAYKVIDNLSEIIPIIEEENGK